MTIIIIITITIIMIIIINDEINKLNLRRTCQQSLLKSLMAVGTKDLLNLSVLQPLTAAAPLTFQDAVERMSIIIQNRI